MIAINCQSHTQWKQSGASKDGPEKSLPIITTLFPLYTQGPDGMEECLDVT
jgi:hypothetical protein